MLYTPWRCLHGLAVQRKWTYVSLARGRRTVFLFGGATEQDLSAGHLAVSPQLAGPLLPHWHGHPLSSLSPGHERVRGVEWWGWAALPDTAMGLLKGAGIGRPAAVNGSFPVQIGPPPAASPGKRKTRYDVSIRRQKALSRFKIRFL